MEKKRGPYVLFFKRVIDIICSLLVLVLFCWLYAIIAILVKLNLGSPVLFKQERPGKINPKTGREKIFHLYKFRTMTDARDSEGDLLPDSERLTTFGSWLRRTSMDEIPEAINILNGDMSLIGPRPQLVKDMVFMTDKQRMRHTVKPGLSGLAQVMGRNAITWEEKLNWDLKYIEKITFLGDLKIIGLTVRKVFMCGESCTELDVTDDYGDALLKAGKVSRKKYDALQVYAKNILKEHEKTGR